MAAYWKHIMLQGEKNREKTTYRRIVNRRIQERFSDEGRKEVLKMTRKRVFEILDVTPEVRKEKIAMLKKAIREGAYKVKAEDIAEKILKEQLFEFALTLYNHKSKGRLN